MKLQNKGFTLVELIVVITILAILGSIAFISMNGFSADARNAARATELKQIQTKATESIARGSTVLDLVTTDATYALTSADLAGQTAVDATMYDAGTPNYQLLSISDSDFVDPSRNVAYPMAAATVNGGAFQLAAYNEGDTETALVIGNYSQRTTSDTVTFPAVSGTTTTTVTLTDGAGLLKVGDTVTGGLTITAVSEDKKSLTFSAALPDTTATIALAADESAGLIANGGTAVTNGGATLPY